MEPILVSDLENSSDPPTDVKGGERKVPRVRLFVRGREREEKVPVETPVEDFEKDSTTEKTRAVTDKNIVVISSSTLNIRERNYYARDFLGLLSLVHRK